MGAKQSLPRKAFGSGGVDALHSRFRPPAADVQGRGVDSDSAKVAVEAGVSDYWRKYVGLEGAVVGIDRYGESAPGQTVRILRFSPWTTW